jgi:hypothetical protein
MLRGKTWNHEHIPEQLEAMAGRLRMEGPRELSHGASLRKWLILGMGAMVHIYNPIYMGNRELGELSFEASQAKC